MKHKGFYMIFRLITVVAIITTAGLTTAAQAYDGSPWRSGVMGDATACFDVMSERWKVGVNAAGARPNVQRLIATAADIDSASPPCGLGCNSTVGLTSLMKISLDLYTHSMCR